VLICEVRGGRAPYQIAVERDAAGRLQLHCTCADAVFRAEAEGRFCKHVQGLLEFGRMDFPAEEPPPSPPAGEVSDAVPKEGPGFGSLAG
jgi:hypothetical protein